jgi:hypothetical protein
VHSFEKGSTSPRCRRGPFRVQDLTIVSAGLRPDSLRPDLTTVPLEGVEPSHIVLATRAGDRHRLVAAFVKAAQAHLGGR